MYFYSQCSDHVGALLAGVLQSAAFTYLLTCYVDFPPRYSDNVGPLLAGALKAQLYVFIKLRERASRLREFFILDVCNHVGVLLAGALQSAAFTYLSNCVSKLHAYVDFYPRRM